MHPFKSSFPLAVVLLLGAALTASGDADADLRAAAGNADINGVREALKNGARVNNQHPTTRWAALIHASDKMSAPIIEILLKAGADPNVAERDGWTPLMFSAIRGHIEACRLLIDAGANLEAESKNGWTVLKAAKSNKNPAVAEFISNEIARSKELKIDNAGLGKAFLGAVKEGNVAVVKDMLSKGIDPNTLSANGWTGLTYATASGHLELVRMLVQAGTDVNKADKDGWTPIMFAAYQVCLHG
jgi:ankyrin repeat protein